MRPLRLELKGFTSFRDPVEVDFRNLDLFAISGPTGSGKSSLLDAMTYALYGRVERVGDRVSQLISQGQSRMAVTLEYEVGRERYRITRSTAAKGASKILLERSQGRWVDPGGRGRGSRPRRRQADRRHHRPHLRRFHPLGAALRAGVVEQQHGVPFERPPDAAFIARRTPR